MATATMVKLRSNDGQLFEVESKVATQSGTVANMLSDTGADETIPLPLVHGAVLAKVLEYCKYHADDEPEPMRDDNELDEPNAEPAPVNEDRKEWDKQFLDVDQSMRFSIITAANYLDIKNLLKLAVDAVAETIKGKTSQEIRDQFGIEKEFAPGEEERVKKENSWAFA